MEKIAIIGANEFQRRLILKAKEMGLETHVFAWRDGAVGAADAEYFYPISIVEREQILDECRRIGIHGITSIASDLAVCTVNYVAEKMGLPGNSIDSIERCTNKYRMRDCLKEAGLRVPQYLKVSAKEKDVDLSGFTFPIIVKPTDRSGSRSITELESTDGLEEAIRAATEVSFEKCAIIEEYLTGNEYSAESISYHGKHHMLAVTKKYTTGAPNYIETGHMIPADIPTEEYDKIRQTIYKALDALSVTNGASHAEFKYENGEVKLIEIGARMGGDFIGSDLVYLATGMDFVKMTIDVALGRQPDLTVHGSPATACVKFILNNDDVEKWREFSRNHRIYRQSDIEHSERETVIDSSSRWGYYIYRLNEDATDKGDIS